MTDCTVLAGAAVKKHAKIRPRLNSGRSLLTVSILHCYCRPVCSGARRQRGVLLPLQIEQTGFICPFLLTHREIIIPDVQQ